MVDQDNGRDWLRRCAIGESPTGTFLERIRWPDPEEQRMVDAIIASMMPDVLRNGHHTMTFRGCRIDAWRRGWGGEDNVAFVQVSIRIYGVHRSIG